MSEIERRAVADEPKIHTFAINPIGGGDIFAEGDSRFSTETEVSAYVDWARKRIADLEAALRQDQPKPDADTAGREAGAEDGWLPIDTAPRDGTPVLITRQSEQGRRFVEASAWLRDTFGEWHWGMHGEYDRSWHVATHWRPLPEPPRALPLRPEPDPASENEGGS